MKQNPGIKVTEVVKQIAKMWQALSKDDKLRYKELAKMGKFDRILSQKIQISSKLSGLSQTQI